MSVAHELASHLQTHVAHIAHEQTALVEIPPLGVFATQIGPSQRERYQMVGTRRGVLDVEHIPGRHVERRLELSLQIARRTTALVDQVAVQGHAPQLGSIARLLLVQIDPVVDAREHEFTTTRRVQMSLLVASDAVMVVVVVVLEADVDETLVVEVFGVGVVGERVEQQIEARLGAAFDGDDELAAFGGRLVPRVLERVARSHAQRLALLGRVRLVHVHGHVGEVLDAEREGRVELLGEHDVECAAVEVEVDLEVEQVGEVDAAAQDDVERRDLVDLEAARPVEALVVFEPHAK